MSLFKIPLTNIPQSFEISLAGRVYLLTCRWNDAFEAGWVLDFADAQSGTAIASNIPLITGCDILSGLEYLGFNGQMYAYTDGNATAVPTLDNLGVEANLYFDTTVTDG